MTTLTLKQVPKEVLSQLRELAERERRSLNQQVILMLEQALAQPRPSFGDALRRFYQRHGAVPEGTAEALDGLRQRDLPRRAKP